MYRLHALQLGQADYAGQMRGGETGGFKERAQDAIVAIRNAKELLGEGPRFKDVDSVAINAGDAHQQSHLQHLLISPSDLI